MQKKRKNIIEGNAVSRIYDWSLGGYTQKVLVEGKREDLPVVVTLHGGPGSPIPFSVGCRGMFPEFTDRFIMVYWDQLGCGINNRAIGDDFTVDSFAQMAYDLIKEVKCLFPHNKIYIFSMSWGSILSAKILEKDGHAADGVVAWGQIVRNVFWDKEVIETLENSGCPRRKLESIKAAGIETATPGELRLISSSIAKYTEGYQNRVGAKAPVGRVIKGLLASPDYTLKDFMAILVNGYRKNQSLWREILHLDLSQLLREVQIPYVILQGDTDIVASTKKVKELVASAGNVHLQCETVKNSGHMPGAEGMEKVLETLCRL